MSNFTTAVTETFKFDDDIVTVTFGRLKRKHLIKLSPYMTNDETASFENKVKFAEVAGEILPEIVKEFNGLKDSNGISIALDVVIEETYFTKLLSDIMGKVMENSFISEETEGKN